MAVNPDYQGKGLGEKLLSYGMGFIFSNFEQEIDHFWCNARVSACSFYEKYGFKISSEPFHIEGIGKHFVMKYFI